VDGPLREHLRQTLKTWQQRQRVTVVWVTHDQEEAMAVADRLGVLDQGSLQQCGVPAEVYQRPANVSVAQRIGNPPWNLLTGRLVRRDDTMGFVQEQAFLPLPREAGKIPSPIEGRTLVLGLRPDSVRLSEMGLDMEVRLVEFAGEVSWLTLTCGGWRMKCIINKSGFCVGQRVAVSWDWRQARWFDAESGAALSADG
jgi:ABC-type sugar transport system ATPase subunit